MIVKPFLSRRNGDFKVAVADPLGFVTVHRFKTKAGAMSHAKKHGGSMYGSHAATPTSTKKYIVR